MGHATVQMTERYSHLAPSALQETISLLEKKNPAPNSIIFGQPVGNEMEKLLAKIL